ncbi:MAG: glycosyltransferase family 39 protein [Sedimentisphaerales bacterium]|nr:glycosyltransferase family 39 protein [Sedimentisphaerales bacterium]
MRPLDKKYLYGLLAAVAFLAVLVLLKSVNGPFWVDEFEHIHTTWYAAHGHIPYRDFFQHHNPLLWYSMVPFLWVFGETTETVIVYRIAIFAVSMGIAYTIYRISKLLTGSREAGLISVAMLLSMAIFVDSTVEIRPDVPMLLFALISVHFLVRHIQTGEAKSMMLCGLFASISFLFLQKVVLFLFAYGAIFAYRLIRRRLSIRDLLYFCSSFILVQSAFFLCLTASGCFSDYILTNWRLNALRSDLYSSLFLAKIDFSKQYRVFWGLSVLGVVLIFADRKTCAGLKTVAFISVVLFAGLLKFAPPWRHYFMPLVAVLSIVVGCFLKLGFDNLKLGPTARIALIGLILFIPVRYVAGKANIRREDNLLEKAEYVLANTEARECVYDGYNLFNLYRPDLHYFWYAFDEAGCLNTYNKITDNKYGDYDTCELVRSRKPKFISDYELDISKCGLDGLYRKTEFDGLYIRKAAE